MRAAVRVERRAAVGPVPRLLSADEGADVGLDAETNVSPDCLANANALTGKILQVTVEQEQRTAAASQKIS